MTTQPAGEHHTGTLNLAGQGNPDRAPQPAITGAAAVIGDAAWRVNWTVSKEHPEQAQHDALQALTNVYAYHLAVTMETLRRIAPEAAERVAEHLLGDPDGMDWEVKSENAWAWEQAIRHREDVDPLGHVFPELAGSDSRATIRQQVAEQIAAAIRAHRDTFTPDSPIETELYVAEEIAQQIGRGGA